MKFIVSILVLISTNAFAASSAPALSMTCVLTDIGELLANVNVDMRADDHLTVASHQGHLYQVSVYDMSTSSLQRTQLMLIARDQATGKVLSTAAANFNSEMPHLILQDGASVLFSCFSAR